MIEIIAQTNIDIATWMHSLLGEWIYFDAFIMVSARYLDITFLCLISLYILTSRIHARNEPYLSWYTIHERVKDFFFFVITGLTAWITALTLKLLIYAPRPFVTHDAIHPLFEYGGYDSFPSGHALLFTAITIAAWHHQKGLGILVGCVSILIMASRVIAGIHYPLDIIGGILIGSIIAWGVLYARRYFKHIW